MLPIANTSVIFQRLDDGAVLFAPDTEVYFGLNSVGAAIWEMFATGERSFDEICAAIGAQHPEVAASTIRADVLDLLDQLVLEGLARRAVAGASDADAAS